MTPGSQSSFFNYFFIFSIAITSSYFLTRQVRNYALKKNVLDIPIDRSSHTTPTPRGGGIGIVLSFLSGLLLLEHFGKISENLTIAIEGGGVLIAIIGWMDDIRSLPARWRFLIHALAAIFAIYWVGGISEISLGTTRVFLGHLGYIFTFIGILWMINLYNFMDGIDGLAGGEALTLGVAGSFLLVQSDAKDLSFVSWLLAGCSAGFLLLNWPPAKIFMGDVGSGFIGFCFSIIWIESAKVHSSYLWGWMILLSIFISDATFTLISRVLGKEKWYKAHKSHAYQRLVQLGWSHLRVTKLILTVNILILFPLAWYAIKTKSIGFYATTFLYACLLLLWIFIRNKYIFVQKNEI